MVVCELRYEWLENIWEVLGYDYVVMVYYFMDVVEIQIFYLVWGIGLRGLLGIFLCNGWVVCFLLFVSQFVLFDYQEIQGLVYREDFSNVEIKYICNFICYWVLLVFWEFNLRLEQLLGENMQWFWELFFLMEYMLNCIEEVVKIQDGDWILYQLDMFKVFVLVLLIVFFELLLFFGLNIIQANDLVLGIYEG